MRVGLIAERGPPTTAVSSPSPVPSPSPIVCVVTLSVGSTIDGYPNGGSFPVSVTTTPPSGCNWTATTQASWIHIPNSAAGGGSAKFTFTVDPNPGPVRAATLTVAGKIVAFNQTSSTSSGVYKLSVGSTIDGYPSGGTFRVNVTTRPSSRCSWTPRAMPNFCTSRVARSGIEMGPSHSWPTPTLVPRAWER